MASEHRLIYLIIFLSIAAILGPLLAVLPSRNQRALANRRDRAQRAGIIITLREPEDIPPRLQRATDNVLVCYSLRLPLRAGQEDRCNLYVRTRDGWKSRSDGLIPDTVSVLPSNVEVVRVSWESIQVYWDETGDDSTLSTIISTLLAFKVIHATNAIEDNPIMRP